MKSEHIGKLSLIAERVEAPQNFVRREATAFKMEWSDVAIRSI